VGQPVQQAVAARVQHADGAANGRDGARRAGHAGGVEQPVRRRLVQRDIGAQMPAQPLHPGFAEQRFFVGLQGVGLGVDIDRDVGVIALLGASSTPVGRPSASSTVLARSPSNSPKMRVRRSSST
jgi:hypothetical protein